MARKSRAGEGPKGGEKKSGKGAGRAGTQPSPAKGTPESRLEAAFEAAKYNNPRNPTQFSDVHIADLIEMSGLGKAATHELLLKWAREGKVMLSEGDWNAAPQRAKDAHILVRRTNRDYDLKFTSARLL